MCCATRSRWSRIVWWSRSPRDFDGCNPERRCDPDYMVSGIAVQHQSIGMHFPAFQPIQEAHAEQIGLHLSARHHQRRHRPLHEPADRKAVERQPCGLGVTAGGHTKAARLTLDRLAIGRLVERSVPALVVPRGQMKTNLLGMSFLDRLESWEVHADRLMLHGYP